MAMLDQMVVGSPKDELIENNACISIQPHE